MPSLLEKVFSQHREDVEVTAQDTVREKECHSPQAYAPLGLSCVAMCPGHKINSQKSGDLLLTVSLLKTETD